MEIDARGDLLLRTPEGDVHQHKPVIYQEFDGTRTEVSGSYSLSCENQVSFEVGKYDPGKPLIIDPTLSYSTYLGGNGDEYGHAIAVDSSGYFYVTGYTLSTNFPTKNRFQAGGGSYDAFVSRLDPNGSGLVYSTYVGGSGGDSGAAIAVDSDANVYVTGSTNSDDFRTLGPFQAAIGGSLDAFVIKLNTSGSQLRYSTYLGGNGLDSGLGIALDSAGNVYVTGPAGIWVIAPDSTLLGVLAVPERTLNLTWGGPEWADLYIAAFTAIYRLPMRISGAPASYMRDSGSRL